MIKKLSLEANAGSGKTFYLSIRYISLLLMGNRIDEIVCLTFTRKATEEMKTKILSIISNLNEKSIELEEIYKQSHISKKEILLNKDLLLKELEKGMRIITIDSFVLKILRHHSEDVGLNSNFNVGMINPENEIKIFMKKINMEYKEELEYIQEDLEFTNNEINEMFYYLYSHDFELTFLEKYFDNFNLKNFIQLKNILLEDENKTEEKLFQFFKIKEIIVIKYIIKLYKIFKRSIIENKLNKNIVDFNDISNLTYNFITDSNKDISHFRCSHLLIDEFQDTSILQYKILEPFIEDIINNEGTFFYVGDTKQSIYRFRGSNSKLFYFLQKDKELDIEHMLFNYRSSEVIVEYVNNKSRELFKNYTSQIHRTDIEDSNVVNMYFNEINLNDILVTNIKDLIKKGFKYNDITILCRNNSDIEEILNKIHNEIPIQSQSSKKLISFKYVNDLLLEINNITNIKEHLNQKYNDMDNNIKNTLIELFEKYEDKSDIKYNIENIRLDVINDDKLDSVKILTIHKSKGLEFKNVFLIDYFSKPHSIDETIFFTNDENITPKLNINYNNRKNVDNGFKEILKQNIEDKYEDELNLFYVGITRAKNNLFLLKNTDLKEEHFIK